MTNKIIMLLAFFTALNLASAAENAVKESPWLTASLYGNDNDVAALKSVKIYNSKEGYRIYIKNQFGFDCALSLNSSGDPVSLSNCISKEGLQPVCNPNMPNSACAIKFNCFREPNEKNPACFYTWQVIEREVQLSCSKAKIEHICKGKYTLSDTRGYSDSSEFTIARRLK